MSSAGYSFSHTTSALMSIFVLGATVLFSPLNPILPYDIYWDSGQLISLHVLSPRNHVFELAIPLPNSSFVGATICSSLHKNYELKRKIKYLTTTCKQWKYGSVSYKLNDF